jgi:hypothetical protein
MRSVRRWENVCSPFGDAEIWTKRSVHGMSAENPTGRVSYEADNGLIGKACMKPKNRARCGMRVSSDMMDCHSEFRGKRRTWAKLGISTEWAVIAAMVRGF